MELKDRIIVVQYF